MLRVCSTAPIDGTARYASRCSWLFQQNVPTRSPFSTPSFASALASRAAFAPTSAKVARRAARLGPGDAFALRVHPLPVAQDRRDREREILHRAGRERVGHESDNRPLAPTFSSAGATVAKYQPRGLSAGSRRSRRRGSLDRFDRRGRRRARPAPLPRAPRRRRRRRRGARVSPRKIAAKHDPGDRFEGHADARARRADAVEHHEEQRERGRGGERRSRPAPRTRRPTAAAADPARAPNTVTPTDAPIAVHAAAVSESVRGSTRSLKSA